MIETYNFCDLCGAKIGSCDPTEKNVVFDNHNAFGVSSLRSIRRTVSIIDNKSGGIDICTSCSKEIQRLLSSLANRRNPRPQNREVKEEFT